MKTVQTDLVVQLLLMVSIYIFVRIRARFCVMLFNDYVEKEKTKMTVELFFELLAIISVITGFVVEAIKKVFPQHKDYNLIALVTAVVVGIASTFVMYSLTGIAITWNCILYALLEGFFSALCAMVGYDKVIQALKQFGKTKE